MAAERAIPVEEISRSRVEFVSDDGVVVLVMPDGALDKFDPQQIRDLFAYLRATQPLP